MPRATPEQQFSTLLATDASRPFVTYYDERSGERSELSGKSLANWVAKTHHLIGDEFGLGAGDAALLALPAHWISVPIVLGCLTAGLVFTDSAPDADLAFVSPQTLAAAEGVLEILAVAPDSAAIGFRGDPPGDTHDYVVAVRPQADTWASVRMPAGPEDPCLPGLTRAEVAERAAARAAEFGLSAGGRLLSTVDWAGADDWIDAVLAPLAVGGSLVLVRHCTDDSVLDRRMEQERATARI